MKKQAFNALIILLLSLAVLCLSVFLGASGFKLPDIHDRTETIILCMRLKRILCGFITGAALSCAGLVFQTILRNPLAEPYILGVSSGAGLGAALSIVFGINLISIFAIPFSAFLGAALAFAIVFSLASKGEYVSIYSLIISGVIISSVGSSLLMFLITIIPATGLHGIIWWMLGSVEPISDKLLYTVLLIVCFSLFLLAAIAKELNALLPGWEIAHSVGIRSKIVVFMALTLSTVLTASVVSMAGIIGFVGLIVPHITRAIVGSDHRYSIPISAIMGGAFLALCDAIGRWIIAPIEIPVGAITALCGGPFFLFILRKKRAEGWLE
jgi:iron complex transport system permease protein